MSDKEIERKFILRTLPEFVTSKPVPYERYFLYIGSNAELRIQHKGDKYELERKQKDSELGSIKYKLDISEPEYSRLKEIGQYLIIRDGYEVENDEYDISIKVYHGNHEGLIRAEVEFDSDTSALSFAPFEWMGAEITDSELGRDSKLCQLEQEEFEKLLQKYLA